MSIIPAYPCFQKSVDNKDKLKSVVIATEDSKYPASIMHTSVSPLANCL
jgi:hypothetical protein